MRKLYENFRNFQFQKRIISAETICGNRVLLLNMNENILDQAVGRRAVCSSVLL